MAHSRGPTTYRPTLDGIAKESGVSRATVDRVLNDRGSQVRAQTRQAVLDAVARLSAAAGPGPSQTADQNTEYVRIDMVMPVSQDAFFMTLRHEMSRQAASRGDVDLVIHDVGGSSPTEIAGALLNIRPDAQGLGLISMDHPLIRDAIRTLAQRGVKVVTLVSDIQSVPKLGYVGIDNRSAGRLAGYLSSTIVGKGQHKVGVIHGLVTFRGQEEREMGFRHFLSEQTDLVIAGAGQTEPDPGHDYAITRDLIAQHPDLSVIYNMSSGNRDVVQALADSGRGETIAFVGHDLTSYTKQALLSGQMNFVIDQNPRVQVREAYEQLVRADRGLPWNSHPLRLQIICRENIPDDELL
jgi:LacI family transcriptional regulator